MLSKATLTGFRLSAMGYIKNAFQSLLHSDAGHLKGGWVTGLHSRVAVRGGVAWLEEAGPWSLTRKSSSPSPVLSVSVSRPIRGVAFPLLSSFCLGACQPGTATTTQIKSQVLGMCHSKKESDVDPIEENYILILLFLEQIVSSNKWMMWSSQWGNFANAPLSFSQVLARLQYIITTFLMANTMHFKYFFIPSPSPSSLPIPPIFWFPSLLQNI